MSSLSSSQLQKALVLPSRRGSFVLSSIPIPRPQKGQLLLKVHACALNPVDWKIQTRGIIVQDFPIVLGTDISGTVEAIGDGVEGFSVGDRVLTQGVFDNNCGGFQQYTLANADITAKETNISFEQASTIPVGLGTAALGLYTESIPKDIDPLERGSVGLFPPWEEGGRNKYAGKSVLIFGASSSVGQYALQLAKLSGFSPIITTASLHNTAFLQSLGATHVVDRHLSFAELQSSIRQITSKPLEVIFDAISLPETQNAAYELLSPGGCLAIVLFSSINSANEGGKRIVKVFGQVNFPPENRKVGSALYKRLTRLLEEGAIQPNRVEVLPRGLEGIVGGLDRLKNDAVSGVKLVARPQETA
ncbi:GroES-like protein [Wolfiporia cocos MD-104 SS10]|uniref:GroES-like protein n=1 Tax=Wolfiporia cocos (strain MD-104) TaxID=742152 RepID=A0A2H3JAT1_WOLCO|nr:GroES-like protein [Wolfiporia cocos MD-104 SS10]